MTVQHEAIARELYDAERTAVAIAPLGGADPALTLADAYRIQTLGRALRLADGGVLAGHKVGLTSTAMQELLGVDQPDFGYLLRSMLHEGGAPLDVGSLIAPRVEAEVAFRLGTPLAGPGVTREQVLAATAEVAPSIEVIDSRIVDWRIDLTDTVADNASCGAAVIGAWRALDGADLAAVEGVMTVTGADGAAQVSAGPGSAVLGHPAEAIAWLARALHEYGGESLAAGEVILPGAVSRALPIAPGSRVHVDFAELGVVETTIEGTRT